MSGVTWEWVQEHQHTLCVVDNIPIYVEEE